MNGSSYSLLESRINPLGQKILAPPPHLKEIVRYIWYYDPGTMERICSTYLIVPDGNPGIIFNHTAGRATIADYQGGWLPMAFVHGQGLVPCINHDYGNSFVMGVTFFPAAFKRIFTIDAHEATNTIIPLNELAGFDITGQMINCNTPEQLFSVIINYLAKKFRDSKNNDEIINHALSTISKKLLTITPATLPEKYDLSQRQFQRRFKEYVGLSPETFIRVMKFQRSLYLIKTQQYTKLSDIAYELGYSDQAHFIHEFKKFSGITPKSVIDHLPRSQNTSEIQTFRILAA